MSDNKPLTKKQIAANRRANEQKREERNAKIIQDFKDSYSDLRSNLGERGLISKKIDTIYENIYLQCIKNEIDTCTIILNDSVRAADSTACQLSKVIETHDSPEIFLPCYQEITISWFLSVSDALGVSFTKLMTKISSKEKQEIIYALISEQSGLWDAYEDARPEQGFTIVFEQNDINFLVYYDRDERTVNLIANISSSGIYYYKGEQTFLNPFYQFPSILLYSEQEGYLKTLFMRELYLIREEENVLFQKHKYIQDVLVKPNDKIFRFLSPYTKCMGESGKHSFEDVIGVVNILSFAEHKTVAESFNGFYCPECFRYFIPEEEYRRLKKIGIICCKILGSSQSEQEDNPFSGFSAESVLHQYGYNVNALNNLSEENRRDILAFILENKILSRGEIVGHIEMLINLARNRMNMANAISKWRSDIAYINAYERTDRFVVDCETIKVPNREKDTVGQVYGIFEGPTEG